MNWHLRNGRRAFSLFIHYPQLIRCPKNCIPRIWLPQSNIIEQKTWLVSEILQDSGGDEKTSLQCAGVISEMINLDRQFSFAQCGTVI